MKFASLEKRKIWAVSYLAVARGNVTGDKKIRSHFFLWLLDRRCDVYMRLVIQSGHVLYHRNATRVVICFIESFSTLTYQAILLVALTFSTLNPLFPSDCLAVSTLLVSTKPQKPATVTNQLRGSFRCANNRLTCFYINDGHAKYTFNSAGET